MYVCMCVVYTLTGALRSTNVGDGYRQSLKTQQEGIRVLGDGLGVEAVNRGHIVLRDSSSRFFIPQYTGERIYLYMCCCECVVNVL